MINDGIFQWKLNSEIRKGRNVSEGYARGWGIQFSDLREKVKLDPLYHEAVELSYGRTIMTENNRINIFLIMKYCLKDIPSGNIVEFGSYKGGQAIFMSHVARKLLPTVKVYAFDTFKGIIDWLYEIGFKKVKFAINYSPVESIFSNGCPYPDGHMWPVTFLAVK